MFANPPQKDVIISTIHQITQGTLSMTQQSVSRCWNGQLQQGLSVSVSGCVLVQLQAPLLERSASTRALRLCFRFRCVPVQVQAPLLERSASTRALRLCFKVCTCTVTGTVVGTVSFNKGSASLFQVSVCTRTGTGTVVGTVSFNKGSASLFQVSVCTRTGTGTVVGTVSFNKGSASLFQVSVCTRTGTGTVVGTVSFNKGSASLFQVSVCTRTGTGDDRLQSRALMTPPVPNDRKHYPWSRDAEANDTIRMGSDHRCVMAKFEISNKKEMHVKTKMYRNTEASSRKSKMGNQEKSKKSMKNEATDAEAKAMEEKSDAEEAAACAASAASATDGQSITESHVAATVGTGASEAQETKGKDKQILALI